MKTLATRRQWLPGDTPILVGQYGAGHRITSTGSACGTREETRRTTVVAAAAWGIPPCPQCWGGEQPW